MDKEALEKKIEYDQVNTLAICAELAKLRIVMDDRRD